MNGTNAPECLQQALAGGGCNGEVKGNQEAPSHRFHTWDNYLMFDEQKSKAIWEFPG